MSDNKRPRVEEIAAPVEKTVEVKPSVQAPIGFSSYYYPDLSVLVRRATKEEKEENTLFPDKVAVFKQGHLTTDDPEIIAKLRALPKDRGVREDTDIDPESLPVAIVNDEEGRIATNARAARRLQALVIPQ